ncbi:MAG TPA: hypothetical protein VKM55_13795 [Candidatus Lokiarchaeia archaeon]|nr:hypothetical protein [Candidatus Lokiarchaeia archaeon]
MVITEEIIKNIWDDLNEHLIQCLDAETQDVNLLEEDKSYYSMKNPADLEFSDILKRILDSLRNRRNVGDTIPETNDSSRNDGLNQVFGDYQPRRLSTLYTSWEQILSALAEHYLQEGKEIQFQVEHHGGYWNIYSQGAKNAIDFLSTYNTPIELVDFVSRGLNGEDDQVVLDFVKNEIASRIKGMHVALASDFLKEIGFKQIGKPDVWIIKIFLELNFIAPPSKGIDEVAFKKIREIARIVDVYPVIVDKVFWLLGTGDFDRAHDAKIHIDTKWREFVAEMKFRYNI